MWRRVVQHEGPAASIFKVEQVKTEAEDSDTSVYICRATRPNISEVFNINLRLFPAYLKAVSFFRFSSTDERKAIFRSLVSWPYHLSFLFPRFLISDEETSIACRVFHPSFCIWLENC
jgi:hypothetical protein